MSIGARLRRHPFQIAGLVLLVLGPVLISVTDGRAAIPALLMMLPGVIVLLMAVQRMLQPPGGPRRRDHRGRA